MPGKRQSKKAPARVSSAKGGSATVGNGIAGLIKELWEAAVTLRGSIEPGILSPMPMEIS